MGLHICNVVPRGVDSRGEYVEVANDAWSGVNMTGLLLTDYTATQQRPHIYRFPSMADGSAFMLDPGQSAYVFTGHGSNQLTRQGDWLLFAGRSNYFWNNSGDVAYLRRPDGTFIDHMTVGEPKRHPGGHRAAA
jgi:hypothetical protein